MRKSLLCAALLAAAPLAASAAEGISYDYAEIGYTQHEIDFKNISGEDKPDYKGGYARGSYNVTDRINVMLGYSDTREKYSQSGYRVRYKERQAEIGVGFHTPITDRLDFTTDLTYAYIRGRATDNLGNKATDATNAGRLTVGVAAALHSHINGWAKIGYLQTDSNAEELKDFTVGNLGALFKINDTWGITTEAEIQENRYIRQLGYRVGVRASF